MSATNPSETIPVETAPPAQTSGDAVSDYLSGLNKKPSAPSALSSWENFIDFIEQNQVVLVLGLAGLALLLVFLWIFLRWHRRRVPGPAKSDSLGWAMKLICILLMAGLISSDFMSLMNMFTQIRMTKTERPIFAITFALFLEGFPFVLGIVVPKIVDKAQIIEGKKKEYTAIAWICFICMLITFALSVVIRLMFVNAPSRGGLEAYMSDNYLQDPDKNDTYLGQFFLFFSPILTSILAFVVSYVAFGSNNLDDTGKQLRKALARYNWYKKIYEDARDCSQDARGSLWYSLGNSRDVEIPDDYDVFRNDCHVRIHDMIISNCLAAYPSLLKRYNDRVEAALGAYIHELAGYSTVPHLITRITVDEIVEAHDNSVEESVNAWKYEVCEQDMAGDLEGLLSSAIIMAQFHRAAKKHNVERDR